VDAAAGRAAGRAARGISVHTGDRPQYRAGDQALLRRPWRPGDLWPAVDRADQRGWYAGAVFRARALRAAPRAARAVPHLADTARQPAAAWARRAAFRAPPRRHIARAHVLLTNQPHAWRRVPHVLAGQRRPAHIWLPDLGRVHGGERGGRQAL